MDFEHSLTPPVSPGFMDSEQLTSSPVLRGKHRNRCKVDISCKSSGMHPKDIEYSGPLECRSSIHGKVYTSETLYDDTLIGRANSFWDGTSIHDLGPCHSCSECRRNVMDQVRCLEEMSDISESANIFYEALMYLQDLDECAKEWTRCTMTQSSHHLTVAKKYRKFVNDALSFVAEFVQESCQQEDVCIDSLVNVLKLLFMMSTQSRDALATSMKPVIKEDIEMREFGGKCRSSPLRELLHVQADIQATVLKILIKFSGNPALCVHIGSLEINYDNQDLFCDKEFHWKLVKNIFGLIMKLAIEKYLQLLRDFKNDKGDFLQTVLFRDSPFSCLCIQQLATLSLYAAARMQQSCSFTRTDADSMDTQNTMLGTYHGREASLDSVAPAFWKMISSFINSVVQDAQSKKSGNGFDESSKRPIFHRFDSVQDALSFCWWWTWHSAHLFFFDLSGNYQSKLITTSSSVPLLSRLLRLSLTSCEGDLKLLASHLICYQAISSLWRTSSPSPEDISSGELAHFYLLWAHFSKKLNITKKLDKLGMHKYTMKDDKNLLPHAWISKCERFLKYEKSSLTDDSEKVIEDAFKIFLSIFGELMNLRCWNRMKDRFLSRLSSNEIKNLSDVGLSRLIQLFLIVAMSKVSDEERVAVLSKLLEYLDGAYLSKTDYRKQKVLLNGLFACMLISIRFAVKLKGIAAKCGKTISLVLKIFSESVKNVEQHNSLWKIICFYFRNLTELCQISNSFEFFQYLLIPSIGMHNVLENARSNEVSVLSECLTMIFSSLSSHVARSPGDESTIGCNSIFNNICSSFLPWLKEIVRTECNATEEIVDTVIGMCEFLVQRKDNTSNTPCAPVTLTTFTEYFGCCLKVVLKARFLFLLGILSHESEVLLSYLNVEDQSSKTARLCIIQGAIKCVVLHPNREDQDRLMRCLLSIDDVKEVVQCSGMPEGRVSLHALLCGAENTYKTSQNFTERNELKEKVSSWFGPLSEVIRSFAKSYSTTGPDTTMNIYQTCAFIALHCHGMLYSRGACGIIVQIFDFIVLPRWVYLSREKTFHPGIFRALTQTLSMYVECLLSIESPGDNYIKRVLSDLVGVYLTRFPAGLNSASHPFRHVLADVNPTKRHVFIRNLKDCCFKGPESDTKLTVVIDILHSWCDDSTVAIVKEEALHIVPLLEKARSTLRSLPAVMQKVKKLHALFAEHDLKRT